jgi:SAM-dependent methyltransferase
MRRRAAEQVARAQFEPGLLGLLVNPFYFARRGLHEHLCAVAPAVRGRVLDVGCGRKPYRRRFRVEEYLGLELDTPHNREHTHADAFYGGDRFPFEDRRFDSVVTFQVFEHVFEPDRFLSEVNRVLVEDGTLLLCVPFVWDEHEQPVDYARYSSFGLRHLLERHGFRVEQLRKSVDDLGVVFQLVNCYLYKKTVTKNPYLNLLICLSLMAPVNIVGQLLRRVLPRNDDLYLDNVVVARKIES